MISTGLSAPAAHRAAHTEQPLFLIPSLQQKLRYRQLNEFPTASHNRSYYKQHLNLCRVVSERSHLTTSIFYIFVYETPYLSEESLNSKFICLQHRREIEISSVPERFNANTTRICGARQCERGRKGV